MPENLLKDLTPLLVGYGVRVLGALVALWISFRISSWFQQKITRGLSARKFDKTLSIFFGNLARYLVLIAAILACLGLFGIETTSFAAILGAAGLAIGLAFQGTLSNFSAGVMVLVFRPFTVGDYIKVGDLEGTVAEINLFVCALNTLDNRRLVVPNSTITSGAIENYTANELRRVDICVGVDYGSNLAEVRKVLDAAAATVPHRDPKRGHDIFLESLGDSSVNFQVRVWAKPEHYWAVWDAGTEIVKVSLDNANIPIPFPQMDVHLDKVA